MHLIKRLFNFFSRYGILGRKRQVICSFSWEKNAGINVNVEKWEQLYQEIRKQYHEIRVHKLWSTRIGEYIIRYLAAVEDSQKNAQKGILDVFVLSDCINHNARLSKIMGRNIQIVDEENVDKWKYILCRFPKVEFTKYWDEYAKKDCARVYLPINIMQYFALTEEEKREGEYKKALMGIQKPFVCAASRDAAYLNSLELKENTHYHDYRNSDINQLNLSAGYLSQKGITMIRMGRCVEEKVHFDNCIDYANEFYDDLMDIILMKDCKFYVGDLNGINLLPISLDRPVATKNVIPVFDVDYGSEPQNPEHYLYIFKKYYCKLEERYLSIKEMMQIEKKLRSSGQMISRELYAQFGIDVVDNSAEEILDLVMEMNERIDGKWIETQESIELQKEYLAIYKEWCIQEKIKENRGLYGRVGTSFLKKNKFLLAK